jgi:hypothetical protein
VLGNTEGVHWRIARRRLRGITQQAVAPTPPASHHVVAVAFGHPGASLTTDREGVGGGDIRDGRQYIEQCPI